MSVLAHVDVCAEAGSRLPLRAAEFFAGIGLVRVALARSGIEVVFANDIEPFKRDMYVENFGDDDFLLADVRTLSGNTIPSIDIATASFPCTDLSLAGWRRGFDGEQSSLYWEFIRILEEMGSARPATVVIENVPGFLTSNGGADLESAISGLNRLGYTCDIILVDAAWFVPQSRRRMFIVAQLHPPAASPLYGFTSPIRPAAVAKFLSRYPSLTVATLVHGAPEWRATSIADVVEHLDPEDPRWWDGERMRRFSDSLSDLNTERLEQMRANPTITWATTYRRTRSGRSTWEIRADEIAGCLRTARGGSSKQAVVEAGKGTFRIRWLTSREYGRLQGVPDYRIPPTVTENQALFGFGDAVCVPAVEWVLRSCLPSFAVNRVMSS
ncbi:MAG: DNA cytosine methyltransferase [Dehalococcoidia bacterium]